jgi:hypothetical protein
MNLDNNNSNVDKLIKTTKKQKQRIPAVLKRQVWDYWIGKEKGISLCLCCNISEIEKNNFDCGHIIVEINGGELLVTNLKPICGECNSSMNTMNMDNFIKMYGLDKYNNLKQKQEKIIKPDVIEIKGVEVYFCKCCEYYTDKDWHFKAHLRSIKHSDNSNDVSDENQIFCCIDCDNIYMSKQSLSVHSKKEHPVKSDEKKIFCCIDCDNIYMSKQALSVHSKKEHPVKSDENQRIAKLENALKKKDKQLDKALDIAKENSNTANTKMNILKYAKLYLTDAEPLEELTG